MLLIVGLKTRPVALMTIGLFSIIFFVYSAADPFGKKALLFLFLAVYGSCQVRARRVWMLCCLEKKSND
ncbi:MAG: hypothetical protein IPP80_13940 [Ignavibacteria bacterium]|nr:hypothetical protein [Ignavibacteria bacterium]